MAQEAYVESVFCIDDIKQAFEIRDPKLNQMIVALAQSADPKPKVPVREGTFTYQEYRRTLTMAHLAV